MCDATPGRRGECGLSAPQERLGLGCPLADPPQTEASIAASTSVKCPGELPGRSGQRWLAACSENRDVRVPLRPLGRCGSTFLLHHSLAATLGGRPEQVFGYQVASITRPDQVIETDSGSTSGASLRPAPATGVRVECHRRGTRPRFYSLERQVIADGFAMPGAWMNTDLRAVIIVPTASLTASAATVARSPSSR